MILTKWMYEIKLLKIMLNLKIKKKLYNTFKIMVVIKLTNSLFLNFVIKGNLYP